MVSGRYAVEVRFVMVTLYSVTEYVYRVVLQGLRPPYYRVDGFGSLRCRSPFCDGYITA